MKKIKKGDDVIVIAGKDKGKRGSVIRIAGMDRLVVKGVNVVKKHQKPNPSTGAQGGIVDQEHPMHISNVAIYNFNTKKSDRVGVKVDGDGNKVRIFKSDNELIES